MKWKIYYGDLSTFSSDDGPPPLAPVFNVQIIAQADPQHGRVLLSSKDYYWWSFDFDQWMCGNENGLWDYLAHCRTALVLFARSMRTEDYTKLYERAVADPDLPPKSAINYALEEQP